jgi:inner membrane transporter RhtA
VSTPSSRTIELQAVLAAAIGSVSVGFVPFFVTGLQKAGIDTVSTLVWRYLVALSVLLPLALFGHRLVDEWQRGGRWLFLNGLTLGTFQVFCYFKAVETLPTSVVITIFYCYPLLAVMLDRMLFRIPVTTATVAGILTIVAGVALTSLPGFRGGSLDLTGVFYVLLSAVGYAAYIAAAYPATRKLPPVASATFIYLAYLLTFGTAAIIGGFAIPSSQSQWLAILFIGTLGGALQILSFAFALPRLASSGYAVIVCLEFVTVVLAGVWLLGETLTPIQWLGIALVLAGIVLSRVRKSEPKSPAGSPPASQLET